MFLHSLNNVQLNYGTVSMLLVHKVDIKIKLRFLMKNTCLDLGELGCSEEAKISENISNFATSLFTLYLLRFSMPKIHQILL